MPHILASYVSSKKLAGDSMWATFRTLTSNYVVGLIRKIIEFVRFKSLCFCG